MATPLSGAASYCTGAQFLVRYDSRTLAQLLSDTGTDLDASSVVGDSKLAAILKAASGKLEAAALLGGRYTPTDLAALTGNMAEFLAQLVADIAIVAIYRRRPSITMPAIPQVEEADRLLNALAEGHRIFGLQETADAGHLQTEDETFVDVEARNLSTYIARDYFGRRANRLQRQP